MKRMMLAALVAALACLTAGLHWAHAAGPVVCADATLTGVVNGPDLIVPAGTTCTFDHAIVKGGYHVDGSINATNATTQSGGETIGEDYSSNGSTATGGLNVMGAESLVNSIVSGGDHCGVLAVFVNSTITGARSCSP